MTGWDGSGTAFAIVAVLTGGWAVTALLLALGLRLGLFTTFGTKWVVAGVLLLCGAAGIPAAPGAAAWLAVRNGWSVAAWILAG